jgi:hypothetical protein
MAKFNYRRVYIGQVFDTIIATEADSKEDAFNKLKPALENLTDPSPDYVNSLDDFLTEAFEEREGFE